MLNKTGEVKNEAIDDGKKIYANSFKGVGFSIMVPGTSPEEQKRSVASSREPVLMIDQRGFVIIWRKITETSFFKDSYAYHLASYILISANHKDKIITFNGSPLEIKRGQLIAGRYSLSHATGIKPSTIRNKLALLKNIGFLDIKSNNKFSIITVCNYSSYQELDDIKDSKKDNHRTTRGQPKDTNNNDNNDNNDNKNTATQEDFLKELGKTYPHININQEMSKIDGWLLANPHRKKTKRFVVNWFNRVEPALENKAPKVIDHNQRYEETQKYLRSLEVNNETT